MVEFVEFSMGTEAKEKRRLGQEEEEIAQKEQIAQNIWKEKIERSRRSGGDASSRQRRTSDYEKKGVSK